MTQRRVTALVGAQFGSEGKGLIAEKLAANYPVHVRTGAPNAGHTYFVDRDVTGDEFNPHDHALGLRTKVVARSVPCGAANPDALLIIGPGGLIDIELLLEEIRELDALGLQVSDRLFVDAKACVIDPVRHHGLEGGVDGEAHRLIGSTGEGVGPARMAKIARGTFRDWAWAKIEQVGSSVHEDRLRNLGVRVVDTALMLNKLYDAGSSIMLEGTQGSGLSMVHGPWPYCTSTDTNAGQLAVDAGLAPHLVTDSILVARTFPIRVAGNSGPLPNEINWATVGQPEERTTVTKKVRRVAGWSDALVRRAIMLNRPREIALTFWDYVHPEIAGATSMEQMLTQAESAMLLLEQLADLEARMGVGVSMLGTGPDTIVETDGRWRKPVGVFIDSEQQLPETLDWPTDWTAYGIDPLAVTR